MKSQKAIDGILMSYSFVSLHSIGFCGIAVGKSPVDDVAIKGYDTFAISRPARRSKARSHLPSRGMA